MGVFGAMNTALSGLRGQAYALENISGNIANSRTTGFKRVDTNFIDLIPDTPQNRELAGSVLTRSLSTNTIQGDIVATSVDNNVAINGDGFFLVAERQAELNGVPTFSQTNLYTRRGDFDFDRNGFLVNGAGYYLKGLTLDPVTGAATTSEANVIRITNDSLPPRATTRIEYRATLPATPQTAAWQQANGAAGSDLLVAPASTFAATYPASTAGPPTLVAASDDSAFRNRSIQGGTITAYDSLGRPVPVELRWAKTVPSTPGPPPVQDQWQLFVQTNPVATGAATRWTSAGTFSFDPATGGRLTSPSTVPIPTVTVNGVTVSGINITTGTGATALQQNVSAGSDGQLQANSISQDGYSAGVLQRTSISDDGRIVGSYSNGQVAPLAQLLTARFPSPNSLKRLDGGAFSETVESGLPLVGSANSGGTQLVGGSVEQSNTDIADEFSKMIVTQQAYSANTRVITTSQQMLSDILNIIR